ncbi:MAG: phosphate ABC transporter substrate-binding protein [Elainella sp. Prado103]|jgi:phosphate transport system substrate-binding protein|nr:phosphate ABC transporter substrate-binding protein [Elainella sp. Prado103]
MTSKKNDLPALLLTLLVTLGLLGGGIWFVVQRLASRLDPSLQASPSTPTDSPTANLTPSPSTVSAPAPALDTSQPDPSVLAIDGSVSLVALMKQLQNAYLQINPNLPTTYGIPDGRPNGTNAGLQNLRDGKVSMAVSSRPLEPEEIQLGLQAVPIVRDALAVAVGVDNPYQGNLTLEQLKQIFQGKIVNWSEVGGPDRPIRVINRSPDSGTYTFFQDVVLLGEPFAPDSPTFTTAQQDETTPLLRALGEDGITYSTVTQLANQQTVRMVSIDGISPIDQVAVSNGTYPISRIGYLVVLPQTSPAVKQFIDLTRSEQGKAIIRRLGFTPVE